MWERERITQKKEGEINNSKDFRKSHRESLFYKLTQSAYNLKYVNIFILV